MKIKAVATVIGQTTYYGKTTIMDIPINLENMEWYNCGEKIEDTQISDSDVNYIINVRKNLSIIKYVGGALPIFSGDKIIAFFEKEGNSTLGHRYAEQINLLDKMGEVKSTFYQDDVTRERQKTMNVFK